MLAITWFLQIQCCLPLKKAPCMVDGWNGVVCSPANMMRGLSGRTGSRMASPIADSCFCPSAPGLFTQVHNKQWKILERIKLKIKRLLDERTREHEQILRTYGIYEKLIFENGSWDHLVTT